MDNSDDVIISFLGGLGEIGRNCMIISQGDAAIMIDCGVMFPHETTGGVNLILPNLDRIYEIKDKLKAILVTHGHEDHLGAIPFLANEISVDIYSSRFANEILKEKLSESHRLKIFDVIDYQRVKVDPFEIEFVPMTHSVPMAFALMIYTSQGLIVHTGDFKIDLTPLDNRTAGLARIGQLARQDKVRVLFSDSTNAEKEGFTRSEFEVGMSLKQIMQDLTDKRIIFSCFSSHIHRISEAIQIGISQGRKIAFLGRSLVRNIKAARAAGIFNFEENFFIAVDDIEKFSPKEIMIISTGSQGEPFSILSQLAAGNYPFLKLSSHDAVIISAQPIPGREKRVSGLINSALQCGSKVYYSTCHFVHESGHARMKELSLMIQLTNPEYFIPVHGELKQLLKHAELAQKCGVNNSKCMIFKDGDVIKLSQNSIELISSRGPEYYFVGSSLNEIDEDLIRDRVKLSKRGIIVVVLGLNKELTTITLAPQIITKGALLNTSVESLSAELTKYLQSIIGKQSNNETFSGIAEVIRGKTSSFLAGKISPVPVVLPVILEIENES
jgi:ribonuclease J